MNGIHGTVKNGGYVYLFIWFARKSLPIRRSRDAATKTSVHSVLWRSNGGNACDKKKIATTTV